jgi:hypothetical protein
MIENLLAIPFPDLAAIVILTATIGLVFLTRVVRALDAIL